MGVMNIIKVVGEKWDGNGYLCVFLDGSRILSCYRVEDGWYLFKGSYYNSSSEGAN
jgi:hypothetical protein